ncbi:MAG: PEP-CTERM sorting domain-containing protein [Armatimonadota bacterium]
MKKALTILAVGAASASSFASVVYDALYTDLGQTTLRTITNTGSTPRGKKADVVTLAPLTGTNTFYQLNSLKFTLVNSGTAPFSNNLDVNMKFWDTNTPGTGATTPLFSGAQGNYNVTFQSFALTNGFFTVATVTFTNAVIVPTSLTAPTFGVEITTSVNGITNDDVSAGLSTMATGSPLTVGSSTNGWFRDVNNNGVIDQAEGRIFTGVDSNLAIAIDATAVPEPASFAVIGLGLIGLVARRRKSSK